MDKNRPIVAATFGYIIGIIWGLYFNKSIVPFFIFLIIIRTIISFFRRKTKSKKIKGKFKFFSANKIIRYIKLIINTQTIVIIIIFSITSNLIVLISNNKYQILYKNFEDINIVARVVDNGNKKEYSTIYKIKVETVNSNSKYKNTNLHLKVKNNLKLELKYGDKIQIYGSYNKAEIARNYKGFDYSKYLQTLKIYGIVEAKNIKLIQKNANNCIFTISNNIFLKIKQEVQESLPKEKANLLLGILFGYTDEISSDIKENFKQSNLSHILAVSGLHISYIIVAITVVFEKTCGKKKSPIITIFFILAYMIITNFSPSVTRAGIMGIIVLVSKITYNQNDKWSSIALSLLIILFFNPYLIRNAGILLSYGGTIGILLFNKTIESTLSRIKQKNKWYKYKTNKIVNKSIDYINDVLSVSISAQIGIAPITIQLFNTLSFTFFITNFLISFIIGPIIIIGFLFILFLILYQSFSKIVILNLILKIVFILSKFSVEKLLLILVQITELGQLIPLSSINIITLPCWTIMTYYTLILVCNKMCQILNKKKLTAFDKRLINWKNLIKYRIRKNKQKVIIVVTLIVIVFTITKIIPKNLKIYFIDVGQGDATLIITPRGKNILIDGGGSKDYDIGKNILLPYLLDREISKIDYVLVSHFDSDHCQGLFLILQELKIGQVIIGNQFENSENLKEFLKIAKEKRIATKLMEAGDRINIEKNVYLDVIWPSYENKVTENSLNNNSLVCKLRYGKFTMLFTGDIEEIAEEQILKTYKENLNILKSTVLKVAHHGSKTSSTQKFINACNPKIALIGVGDKNLFGHPNQEVLKRLKIVRCKNL